MNLLDLLSEHLDALRDFSNEGGGKIKRFQVVSLFGGPVVAFLSSLKMEWDVDNLSSSLLAGYALFAGVLIAAFTQLAGWRRDLDQRAKAKLVSEAPSRRAVSAAVVHSLQGVLACLSALAVSTLVQSMQEPPRWLSSLSVALATYVVVIMVLIVQALYAGYSSMVDPSVKRADERLLKPAEDDE